MLARGTARWAASFFAGTLEATPPNASVKRTRFLYPGLQRANKQACAHNFDHPLTHDFMDIGRSLSCTVIAQAPFRHECCLICSPGPDGWQSHRDRVGARACSAASWTPRWVRSSHNVLAYGATTRLTVSRNGPHVGSAFAYGKRASCRSTCSLCGRLC